MSEEKQHGEVVLYTHNEDEFSVVLNLNNGEIYIDRNKFRRTKLSDIIDVGYKILHALDYSLSRNYLKVLLSNEDDVVKYSDYVGRCKIHFTFEDVYTNFNAFMTSVYDTIKEKGLNKILIIGDNVSSKYFFTVTQSKSFGYFVRYSYVDIKVLPTKHDIESYLSAHKEELKNTGVVLVINTFLNNATNNKLLQEYENLFVIPLISDLKHERVKILVPINSADDINMYYGFGLNNLNVTVLFREKTEQEKNYEDKIEKEMYDKLREVNMEQLDEKYNKHKEDEEKEKLLEQRKKQAAEKLKNKKKIKPTNKNKKNKNNKKGKDKLDEHDDYLMSLVNSLDQNDGNLSGLIENIMNIPGIDEDKKIELKNMFEYDKVEDINKKADLGIISKEEANDMINDIIENNITKLMTNMFGGGIESLENDVQD
ncbi:MAG: hypothetical protein ACP5G1_03965 [Nanopusillaceae archaeon]